MSLTPSKMIPLGTTAPDFNLVNAVNGAMVSYNEVAGKLGTVVYFICNHCPFVIHVNEELVRVANDYRVQGIGFVAISSNDVEKYPQDGPLQMREVARENDYSFPYLYDRDQTVATLYNAACTPDIYVFNAQNKLIYRGQLDDSRPGNGVTLSGTSLRQALDAILGNKQVPEPQKPSIGCGIKWK